MTPPDPLLWERWDDVDRLLAAALDHPAGERAEHVRRSAGSDTALRDLVLRLLRRLETDEGRLDAPSGKVVLDAFAESDAERERDNLTPGSMVGRYRIVSRRGRGGMATVYEAERADGTYEQRVALKVLRRGLDTDDLVRRFLVERQILSSLTHPNIARLLDGGSTPDGRPYLVMELVEGEPITAWADHRRLDVPARLQLFLAVADAVHAAHRQLVVHRDIKPSNILVDGEGRVRLLDFGIAKLLDVDAEHTAVGAQPLTPQYASPEQLQGGPVTTATDVFQLGLLLRELLTGVRRATRAVRDTDPGEPPVRPSRAAELAVSGGESPAARAALRATTPARLARQLQGDLDVIIGKALRPEPEARYPSADELAADIRRHLRGLPIAAHPESAAYRTRKFIARHPMFVPGVAAALLAIGIFVGTLARQNRRLARERDLAAAASLRARETQAFFIDLFESADPFQPADPERGRNITVVEALALGRERVREELQGQPELRASLLSTIGAILSKLDQATPAREALHEALALRTARADTLSVDFLDDLATLGYLLTTANQFDSAQVVLGRRLTLERARQPAAPERVAHALLGLALAESEVDPLAKVTLMEEAVALLRASGSRKLGDPLRQLGDAYRAVGQLPEAEVAGREAIAIVETETGPDSPSTAMAVHSLGQTLGVRGSTDEAAVLIRRAIAVFDKRLGNDHAFTQTMRNNLAVLLTNAGAFAEAETLYREILEARRARYGEEHSAVAGSYQNVAVAVAEQGRYREAEELAQRAEAIFRRVMPAGSYVVALPMITRAEILLDAGDVREAAKAAGAAAALLRDKVPPRHPAAIVADCRLGRARAALGDAGTARLLLDSAVRRMEGAEGVREAHRVECTQALAALGGPLLAPAAPSVRR